MRNFKLMNNTDSVDIDAKSLGICVSVEGAAELNNARGLHIQIRHNGDKATFSAALELQTLIIERLNNMQGAPAVLCFAQPGIFEEE